VLARGRGVAGVGRRRKWRSESASGVEGESRRSQRGRRPTFQVRHVPNTCGLGSGAFPRWGHCLDGLCSLYRLQRSADRDDSKASVRCDDYGEPDRETIVMTLTIFRYDSAEALYTEQAQYHELQAVDTGRHFGEVHRSNARLEFPTVTLN
jgi:hypothetical protein